MIFLANGFLGGMIDKGRFWLFPVILQTGAIEFSQIPWQFPLADSHSLLTDPQTTGGRSRYGFWIGLPCSRCFGISAS